MNVVYPILELEIRKRGIKLKAIYEKIGVTSRTLYNKRNGIVPFTWEEAVDIQKTFFPDISKDELFSTDFNGYK